MAQQPDEDHQAPRGVTDATVEAVGKLGEYAEWVARARGRLYDFHQMMGHADALLGAAVDDMEAEGHDDVCDRLRRRLVGRNVIPGMWTFEVVEAFEATYHDVSTAMVEDVHQQLLDGRRHVHEARMKADRRRDGPADDTPP